MRTLVLDIGVSGGVLASVLANGFGPVSTVVFSSEAMSVAAASVVVFLLDVMSETAALTVDSEEDSGIAASVVAAGVSGVEAGAAGLEDVGWDSGAASTGFCSVDTLVSVGLAAMSMRVL